MSADKREPLPKGFMREGKFAWPMREYTCIGYTARGIQTQCGVKLESTSGNRKRCRDCQKEHEREWHRLYSLKRRRG